MSTIEERINNSSLASIYKGGSRNGVHQFTRDLTEDETVQLAGLIAEADAQTTQLATYNQALRVFGSHLAAGYMDTQTGVHLKTELEAQKLFTGLAGLLRDEVELGIRTSDTIESIWDVNGVEHVLPTSTLRSLLARYGRHCKQTFDLYAP